jgi:alpha-glucosidase (family GH31 glycosyl hydrolase)
LEFPEDEHAAAIDDEFLFGAGLLVAPVLREGATEREVYLPKGDWFDYRTGRRFAGGGVIRAAVTLDSFPLFVRGGAFIFRQPVVQCTDEMPGKSLRVLMAPAVQSESALYEDDGGTLAYRKGEFAKRRFRQTRDDSSVIIETFAPEGAYRPAARDLILETWTEREPQSVSIQSGTGSTNVVALPHLGAGALARWAGGWTYAEGLLTVKVSDRFESVRFTIQR